jgi:hypothetical protein
MLNEPSVVAGALSAGIIDGQINKVPLRLRGRTVERRLWRDAFGPNCLKDRLEDRECYTGSSGAASE